MSVLRSFAAETHSITATHYNSLVHSPSGHLVYLHFVAILNNAAVDVHVQVFVWKCFRFLHFTYFHFSVVPAYLGAEALWLGHVSALCLTFEGLPDCFHGDCTVLRSHPQCMRVPMSFHPRQHLLLSLFMIVTAILVDKKWYLILPHWPLKAIVLYLSKLCQKWLWYDYQMPFRPAVFPFSHGVEIHTCEHDPCPLGIYSLHGKTTLTQMKRRKQCF